MAWYNLTFISNQSGMTVLTQGINQNSGNWFYGAFLMFTFMLIYLVFNKSGHQNAFLASSFITSLLAGLGFGLGILSGWVLIYPVTIFIFSLFFKIWGET